jgi:hypothetical protein
MFDETAAHRNIGAIQLPLLFHGIARWSETGLEQVWVLLPTIPSAYVDPIGLLRSDAVGGGGDCNLTFSCVVFQDPDGMQVDSQTAQAELQTVPE